MTMTKSRLKWRVNAELISTLSPISTCSLHGLEVNLRQCDLTFTRMRLRTTPCNWSTLERLGWRAHRFWPAYENRHGLLRSLVRMVSLQELWIAAWRMLEVRKLIVLDKKSAALLERDQSLGLKSSLSWFSILAPFESGQPHLKRRSSKDLGDSLRSNRPFFAYFACYPSICPA